MLRLKELREAKGLTQAELAPKLNVSPSSIGMYEQGRRTPPSDVLSIMSTFLTLV